MTTLHRQLHGRIEGRGRSQQDLGMNFPTLYPQHAKAVNRNYLGDAKQFDRELKLSKHPRV